MQPADIGIGILPPDLDAVQGIVAGLLRSQGFLLQRGRSRHYKREKSPILRIFGQHVASLVLAAQFPHRQQLRHILRRYFHAHDSVNRSLINQGHGIGNHAVAVAAGISFHDERLTPISQIREFRIRIKLCRFVGLVKEIIPRLSAAFPEMKICGPEGIKGNPFFMGKTAASSFKEDIGIIRRCPLRIRITEINSLADSIVPSHLVIGKNKKRACYRIFTHHRQTGINHSL